MFSPQSFSRFVYVCLLVGFTYSNQAVALSDEALFQHARESYATKNEIALTEDVNQLKAQQYLLAPYADYWLMLLRLDLADSVEIQSFLTQYADTPFTDRLRGEWLKKLAKQQNWPLFYEQLANFQREDTAVQCYALYGHTQLGDQNVSEQTKALWMTTADLPSNCNQLFDAMQRSGGLSTDDIWARFRLALHENKLSLAKSITARLPNFESANLKLLDRANQSPQLLLDKKVVSFKTRYGVEVNLYALDRLARSKPDLAISTYSKLQSLFDADNRAFGWGRVALHAARGHNPKAMSYFALANGANLDKEQLAWQVRAALRAKNWAAVQAAIAAMPAKQQEEGAWRYWKARALKEQSGLVADAVAIFGQLAKERHYYGWLAAEEIDGLVSNPEEHYTTTDIEVTAIASQPAIKRSLELYKLDMRWEAKSEWVWATRNFDDKQLLAAAEYAMRQKWYDIAIITADNTKQVHDFNLRYPTPYRDLMRTSASDENLDEAWVYGLTRQESRFMHYAKSGVGASGLMQLMPATAKWAAQKMGLNYSHDKIHDLDTNIDIGTYYMRHTLDLMNGQAVMATAAYNAGPSRAKRWMAAEPLEAAIYAETIPFSETRSYVQKVMANAHIYAPRLGSKLQSLKERMGVIPGNGKVEVPEEDNE